VFCFHAREKKATHTPQAIVFFTWWQDMGVDFLVYFDFIDAAKLALGSRDAGEIAEGLNATIICVEMVFFALAHICVFPPEDYERFGAGPGKKRGAAEPAAAAAAGDAEAPAAAAAAAAAAAGGDDRMARLRQDLRMFADGVNFFDMVDELVALTRLTRKGYEGVVQLEEDGFDSDGDADISGRDDGVVVSSGDDTLFEESLGRAERGPLELEIL